MNRKRRFEELIEAADAQLMEFADRARDGGGRYSQGDAPPSPGDFVAAHRKKKRRVAIGAGLGLTAVAGAVGSRKTLGRVGQSVARSLIR